MSSATFFDYAMNQTNAAQAEAIARARRDTVADGTAYRVEFVGRDGQRHFWNGCAYDAKALGLEMHQNGYEVTVTQPDGTVMDLSKVRF